MITNNFSKEQISAIKEKIARDDVEFFYVPNTNIRYLLAKGDDPELNKIRSDVKAIILDGHGFKISKDMVMKFIDGSLDKMNMFVLQNGEIRVEGSPGIKFGAK